MTTVATSQSMLVDATLTDAFAVLIAIKNHAAIFEVEVRDHPGGDLQQGDAWTTVSRAGTHASSTAWAVTELDAPSRVVIMSRSEIADTEITFAFASIDDGTQVSYQLRSQPKGMLASFDKATLADRFAENMRGNMARLKAVIEG